MTPTRRNFFDIMVYTAYIYFILLSGVWFLTSLFKGNNFNYTALVILLVFGLQAYYRHKLTNLIIGILSLFFSFFMLMDVLSTFDLLSKNADFSTGAKLLLTMAVCSIFMAGVLIFSYARLGVAEE